ncbi:MAG: hypothetical protein ACFFCQ_00950 [Promethearchaeota archaeon]
MPKDKKKDQAPYQGLFQGRIQDRDYDSFNDLERVTLYDHKRKASLYIEIPRQTVSLEEKDEIEVQIVPQDSYMDFEKAIIVFNGRLYHLKREEEGYTAFISSGGFQLKITTPSPIDFKTEVTDRFKIIVT